MDVDTLKQQQRPSSSCSPVVSDDDQMDMLSIMMQMEKLPDHFNNNNPFEHPNISTNPFSEIHFSNNIGGTPTVHQNSNESNSMNNIPVSSSSSPIPFIAGHHHDSQMGAHHHFTNMGGPLYCDKKNNNSMAAMREMIFRIAVMQPIHIDPESVKPPKRRNVKISKDPQSVAARHRRERISERIRILQRLVPGGTKMDTASMLDEAIHYLKFLKKQVQSLEQATVNHPMAAPVGFPGPTSVNLGAHAALMRGCQLPMSNHHNHQTVGSLQMLR